jgi:hypothetical protein
VLGPARPEEGGESADVDLQRVRCLAVVRLKVDAVAAHSHLDVVALVMDLERDSRDL